MLDPVGYLGIDLAGAKNQKTALAAIQHYPKERKTFLIDIYERVAQAEGQTSDEALLELIHEMRPGVSKLGVNVPVELPPCVTCVRKVCPMPSHCTVPSVKWMRESAKRAARTPRIADRVRDFTPYTQRPVELYVRYQILPELDPHLSFEIDETLGGNKAPLTARMHFLRRHLKDLPICEVSPKLTVALLGTELGVPKLTLTNYRKLEEGVHARQEILDAMSERQSIFIYERDQRKLAGSLSAFDAFICAYTAMLADQGLAAKVPPGFPEQTGWIAHPLRGGVRRKGTPP